MLPVESKLREYLIEPGKGPYTPKGGVFIADIQVTPIRDTFSIMSQRDRSSIAFDFPNDDGTKDYYFKKNVVDFLKTDFRKENTHPHKGYEFNSPRNVMIDLLEKAHESGNTLKLLVGEAHNNDSMRRMLIESMDRGLIKTLALEHFYYENHQA